MECPWKRSLDEEYTALINGAPEPFRENFRWVVNKVMLYAMYSARPLRKNISAVTSDESMQAIALLSALLEREGDPNGGDTTMVAFRYLFHQIPAEEAVAEYLDRTSSLPTSPCIIYQQSLQDSEEIAYFLHAQGGLINISQYCFDSGDALYTLFRYHRVNGLSFPIALAFFYDFVHNFIACAPPQRGFMRPAKVTASFHDMLREITCYSLFAQHFM